MKALFLKLFILFCFSNYSYALTDIANGNHFVCEGTSIVSVKKESVVSAKSARRKFNSIITSANLIINSDSSSSKAIKKAKKSKKNAKQGLKDINACLNEQIHLRGDWDLLTEDGKTPSENGYNFLRNSFTEKNFTSLIEGTGFSCEWKGSYKFTSQSSALISTKSATGQSFCQNSVGQSRTALVSFQDEYSKLTLDYRPEGTLQVFQRMN